jgi:hypothetical protein
MVKKGTKKQVLDWIPSAFDEADLKKAKKEGSEEPCLADGRFSTG